MLPTEAERCAKPGNSPLLSLFQRYIHQAHHVQAAGSKPAPATPSSSVRSARRGAFRRYSTRPFLSATPRRRRGSHGLSRSHERGCIPPCLSWRMSPAFTLCIGGARCSGGLTKLIAGENIEFIASRTAVWRGRVGHTFRHRSGLGEQYIDTKVGRAMARPVKIQAVSGFHWIDCE
jgi:hypothetical protein